MPCSPTLLTAGKLCAYVVWGLDLLRAREVRHLEGRAGFQGRARCRKVKGAG